MREVITSYDFCYVCNTTTKQVLDYAGFYNCIECTNEEDLLELGYKKENK